VREGTLGEEKERVTLCTMKIQEPKNDEKYPVVVVPASFSSDSWKS